MQKRIEKLKQDIKNTKTEFDDYVRQVRSTIPINRGDVVRTYFDEYLVKQVYILQVLDDVPVHPTDNLEIVIVAAKKNERTNQWEEGVDYNQVQLKDIVFVNDVHFDMYELELFKDEKRPKR